MQWEAKLNDGAVVEQGLDSLRCIFRTLRLPKRLLLAYTKPNSLTRRTLNNPRIHSLADLNRPEYRVVELPECGGIGQVRSIAKAYSVFAMGGRQLGLTEETFNALTMPATPPSSRFCDEVMHLNMCFSLGFLKPFSDFNFGSTTKAFGMPGTGGSFAFADPDAQVGFAYAPNRLGCLTGNDPRERALREAVYRSLNKIQHRLH